MLVIAHHHISDPEGFWTNADQVTKDLPLNLKVLGIYPSMDRKTGTCLWEAENAQEVQQFLDEKAGQFAKNWCYEVDIDKSVGLSRIHIAEPALS
jgi:hypothetical protein